MRKELTLPKLLAKAQTVFNKYVRERDQDLGCISCGGPVEQAGHYFSQGHHSALRYDEVNVNSQCKKCNLFLSGNLIRYRQGLVKKYGSAKVEQLEQRADLRKVCKWSKWELEEIIQKYGAKKAG